MSCLEDESSEDSRYVVPPGYRPGAETSHYSDRKWVTCDGIDSWDRSCPSSRQPAEDGLHGKDAAGTAMPSAQQPGRTWRFKIMTYNILSDQYAEQFGHWLYKDVPPECLPWPQRLHLILQEILFWSPDIVCLQEVSQYKDIDDGLKPAGYEGEFVRRPGGKRRDGCATFWKSARFSQLEHHSINFQEVDLDENVALIVHLAPIYDLSSPEGTQGQASRLVISNTHVCFNPTKGEVKLGQVRTLMNEIHQRVERHPGALAVVSGDFNLVPQCPIYDYIAKGCFNLRGHSKRKLSGQVKGFGHRSFFQLQDPELQGSRDGNRTQLWSHLPCFRQNSLSNSSNTLPPSPLLVGGKVPFTNTSGSASAAASPSAAGNRPTPMGRSSPFAGRSFRPGAAHELSSELLPVLLEEASSGEVAAHAAGLDVAAERTLAAIAFARSSSTQRVETPRNSAEFCRSDSRSWCFKYLKYALGPEAAGEVHRRLEACATLPILVSAISSDSEDIERDSPGASSRLSPMLWKPHAPVVPVAEDNACQAVTLCSDASRLSSSDVCSDTKSWQGHQRQSSSTGRRGEEPIIVSHSLQLESSYCSILGEEPLFTSLHSEFVGTCDYIWYSPKGSQGCLARDQGPLAEELDLGISPGPTFALRPVAVLTPPLIEGLPRGLPALHWGSDHVSLVSEFELTCLRLPGDQETPR